MASFFYVVSLAFHTSVPPLRKCMNTSKKKSVVWERSHSCTRSRRVCYRTNAVHYLPSPLYTCCSDRHASPYWKFICRISMGFTPSLLKKRMTDAVLVWCMLQGGRHLYTTTAPSCCFPASYCHLSATLQTMSILVSLQGNRVVFRIFISLLRFSFDSPSYMPLWCGQR